MLLAAVAAILLLAWPLAPVQVGDRRIGGLAGWLACGSRSGGGRRGGRRAGPSRASGVRARRRPADRARPRRRVLALLLVAILTPVLTDATAGALRGGARAAGALVFGGGHVVLPLLDAGVVTPGVRSPLIHSWRAMASRRRCPGRCSRSGVPGRRLHLRDRRGVAGRSSSGRRPASCPARCSCSPRCPCWAPFARARASPPRCVASTPWSSGILAAALVTPVGTSGVTSLATGAVAAGRRCSRCWAAGRRRWWSSPAASLVLAGARRDRVRRKVDRRVALSGSWSSAPRLADVLLEVRVRDGDRQGQHERAPPPVRGSASIEPCMARISRCAAASPRPAPDPIAIAAGER